MPFSLNLFLQLFILLFDIFDLLLVLEMLLSEIINGILELRNLKKLFLNDTSSVAERNLILLVTRLFVIGFVERNFIVRLAFRIELFISILFLLDLLKVGINSVKVGVIDIARLYETFSKFLDNFILLFDLLLDILFVVMVVGLEILG